MELGNLKYRLATMSRHRLIETCWNAIVKADKLRLKVESLKNENRQLQNDLDLKVPTKVKLPLKVAEALEGARNCFVLADALRYGYDIEDEPEPLVREIADMINLWLVDFRENNPQTDREQLARQILKHLGMENAGR